MNRQEGSLQFWGYERPDGSVGIRNYVVVLPMTNMESDLALTVTREIGPAVTPIIHNNMRMRLPQDDAVARRVLIGWGCNPNVGGIVLLSDGRNNVSPEEIGDEVAKTGKPVERVNMMAEGSYAKSLNRTLHLTRKILSKTSRMQKALCAASRLLLSAECGPSISLNGVLGNAAVGKVFDAVISAGGRAIISETTEHIGAEHIMAEWAVNEEVPKKYLALIHRKEEFLKSLKVDFRGLQPTPWNIATGISTLEEKSLGSMEKGGSTPLVGVLEYGERPPAPSGLYFMDGPGMPPPLVSGLAAAGSQLRITSSGGGQGFSWRTDIGLTGGMPISPSVYVVSLENENEPDEGEYYDIISGVLKGTESVNQLGERLLQEVFEAASGKLTKQEMHQNHPSFQEIQFLHPIIG